MTPKQADLIRRSFDAIWPVRRKIASRFYRYFFELAPLLEAPDQRVAKRNEVRRVNAETCMLATRMTDDRLKQLALVQSAHNCRDHVHELKVLSFHIAGEQALGVGSEFKKVAVKS